MFFHALALSLFTSRRIKLSKFTTPSRFVAKHRRTSKFPFVFSQKTFHIKTLIQYRILLQGDLGEVFIRAFITKWDCGEGAARVECAAGAAARGAGWRRAASPATSRATCASPGTARTDAAPAVVGPRQRPVHPDTRAVAAAGLILMPPGAAAPGAAAPGTPTAPTTPPPARRIAGMPRAGTIATAPPGSLSPPT